MFKVLASREGLVGGTTASGHVIQAHDHFVALPSRKALKRMVVVVYKMVSYVCPVLDVGPWYPWKPPGSSSYEEDPYWEANSRPLAELRKGQIRPGDTHQWPINGAGIDLSDGMYYDLGLKGNDLVYWDFCDG